MSSSSSRAGAGEWHGRVAWSAGHPPRGVESIASPECGQVGIRLHYGLHYGLHWPLPSAPTVPSQGGASARGRGRRSFSFVSRCAFDLSFAWILSRASNCNSNLNQSRISIYNPYTVLRIHIIQYKVQTINHLRAWLVSFRFVFVSFLCLWAINLYLLTYATLLLPF